MNKLPLLLALAGTATVAHAQSSVTLSGTVDVGVNYATGSEASRTQMMSGGNTTSKLAFRGQEDLGNGMYAMFWLESGLNADSGVFQATNTNNQPSGATSATGGLTFNRRSIVGLGGTWGAVHLGREWSPTYVMYTSKFDPFALGAGLALNYGGGINPNQIRASNAIAYLSPTVLGGFSLNAQHWRGENVSGTTTSGDGTGSGARLSYDNGPFSAAAVLMRTKYAAGDAIYRVVGSAYDFGLARLSVNVNSDQQGSLKQDGWMVGVTAPVGVTQLRASYSTIRSNLPGEPEGKKLALGVVYNLSKRTALYTTVASIRNSGGASFTFTGATTAANRSATGFDLGLRHNF
nr:porin [uncultured Albidiferax sp.]